MADNGLPIFMYQLHNTSVEDSISVSTDRTGLVRTINLTPKGRVGDSYFLIASAALIEQLADGSYAIDDRKYYIASIEGIDVKSIKVVKQANGINNLVLHLPSIASSGIRFNYSLIW